MRAVGAAALLLRRVRGEAAMLLLLFALIATTSFLFAAAPRLLNRVSDDALRYAVSNASTIDRDVRLSATGTIGPGSEGGVSALRAYGEERQADLAASIDRLVSDRTVGVTTVRFAVPQSIAYVYLRYQDGVADATRLVAGRWPVDRGQPLRQIRVGEQPGPGGGEAPAVFEAALSTAQAAEIDVQVGDRLRLGLDISDALVPRSAFAIAPTDVEIVGLYEPIDPTADEWVGSGLLQPTLIQGPSGVEAIYVTGLVAAETYPQLAAGLMPFRFDWHFGIDPDSLDADQVATLQVDLQRLDLLSSIEDNRSLPGVASTVALNEASFGSGLVEILDRFAVQRSRSLSVLSIAALGPLCLAGAAIAMLAIMLIRRRRGSLLLARGRGASGRLLLGAQLAEAILLAGGAALLGLLLAVYAIPARDAPMSQLLALAVAGAATGLLLAATWPTARRPLMQLERDDPPVLGVSTRRLVLEATVVGIAIVAVVLLRQRGFGTGAIDGNGPFDPLLAAVPLLSGLAAGILLMRFYPLPVRALGWLAARRRDFVPVAGLRTVARHPQLANLPLLVLMLTAAFGAFASVVTSSVERGQVAASYQQIGADFRLESIGIGGLPAALDPSAIPGVEVVATGAHDPRATYVGDSQRPTIAVEAVDARAYAAVTATTAADPGWTRAFLANPSGDGVGTDANPIPAVVSPDFPPGRDELGNGDTFTVEVSGQPVVMRLVQRRAGIPGLGVGANFVMVPTDWVTAALPDAALAPSVMWIRAPTDAAEPLAALVSTASRDVRIVSRPVAYGLIHDAPLGTAVSDGFAIALQIAVLYLAITLVGAVIMSAARRTRDLAYLRTLGVSSRQAMALTAVEHLPPVLLALVPGLLLGVAVANLVEPGLGLADFTGARSVPLSVDWPTLGLVVVVLSVVVVVAIAAGTWLATRPRLVSALRIEDS